MNIDKEVENLSIEPDKIIPILLKHLMVLKNENAFLKNSAAIHSIENGYRKENPDFKNVAEVIPGKNLGINNDIIGIPVKDVGTNNDIIGIPRKDDGINNDITGIPRKNVGINNDIISIPRKDDGIKNVIMGIPGMDLGIKTVFEALSNIKTDGNGGVLIYSVFEQELLKALEHFINNNDGQHTIYSFYTDFVEAIAKRNSDVAKIREAAISKRLEDTHELPDKISFDGASLSKLEVALRAHLPRNSRKDLCKKVAYEMLHLYNYKKATATELCDLTGYSVAGFAKHLPKLMKFGLIKKQPPSNYVLTEKANNILLELFGIPKP